MTPQKATLPSERIEGLLQEAEEKIEAQQMTAAFERLLQLEELEAESPDADLAGRIQALKLQAEKVERRLSAQRQEAREMLESAEACMERDDYEGARQVIERASKLEVAEVDAELAGRIEGLEAEIESRLDELQEKHQEAERLIEEGEQKLAEDDALGAFKAVMRLRHMDLPDPDGELAARVRDLKRRAEYAEHRKADRQEAEELIEAARENVEEWNLDAAEHHLGEATELEVCESDPELNEAAEGVRSELEEAREEISARQAEARELMETAQARLEARSFQSAFETLDALEEMEVVERDEGLAEEVLALRERTETARDRLESERETVTELLSQAREALAQWDVRAARSRIEACARKSICEIDPDLAEEVDRVRAEVEESRREIEQQRGEAISVLAEADWNLTRCNFAEAQAKVEQLGGLQALEHDENLRERTEEIRERIEAEREKLDSERERVSAILEEARAAADRWDFQTVEELLGEAKETRAAKFDSSVRRDIRQVRSEMESARKKARRQRSKARRLLADAWRKVAGGEFDAAMDRFVEAENLDVMQHDERLRERLERRRTEAEKERDKVSADRQKALEVVEEAEQKKAEGDVEGARETIEEVATIDVNELKTEVRHRIEDLREDLGAAGEEPAPVQGPVRTARTLMERARSSLEAGELQEATALIEEMESVVTSEIEEELSEAMEELKERLGAAVQQARAAEEEAEEVPPAPPEAAEEEQIDVESLEDLEAAMDRVIEGEEEEEPEAPAAPRQPVRKAVRKKQPDTGAAAAETNSGGVQTAARTATAGAEGEEGWFYFSDGERVGPMTLDTLSELAAEGRLDAENKVWLPRSGRWTQAKKVPELAEVM